MALKTITPSDSVTLITQCGFQPVAVYCGSGGGLTITTKAGDTIVTSVGDGSWFPGEDIKFINAASTASGLVGRA